MKRLYAVLLVPFLLFNAAYAEDDPMASLFRFQSQMAEQGNVEAIMKLGGMYEEGQGTRLDLDKALEMYRDADSKGFKGAKKAINRVEKKKKISLMAIKKNAERKKAAREKAVRDKAAKEQAARDKVEKEKLLKEKAAKEQAAREKAAKDLAAKTKAANEKAMREQAEKKRDEKIRAAKIKSAREKAAKERAAIRKTMKDKAERDRLVRDKAAQKDALSKEEKITPKNGEKNSKEGFSSNPCNSPAARLMSSCKK